MAGAMSAVTTVSDKKEKVYIFVDYANAYKQAMKEGRSAISGGQATNKTPVTTTLEQSLASFIRELKKYYNTGLAVEKGFDGLFDILKFVKDEESRSKIETYKTNLSTPHGRKAFLEEHSSQEKQHHSKGHRFVLKSNYLLYICCRCALNDSPLRDQCYLFLSHRPYAKEAFKLGKMYARMNKNYQVIFHERITTESERATRRERGLVGEVAVREKEKGVDVNIGIKITMVIEQATRARERIRVVLVSSDADFKPVVEHAVKRKVPIEVWGWINGISAVYQSFLESHHQNSVRLSFLDDYLFQIGFIDGGERLHPYRIKFLEKFDAAATSARSNAEKTGVQISHYPLTALLTNPSVAPRHRFETYEFGIGWWRGGFQIAFQTGDLRTKFERLCREMSDNPLVYLLNTAYTMESKDLPERRENAAEMVENAAKTTENVAEAAENEELHDLIKDEDDEDE